MNEIFQTNKYILNCVYHDSSCSAVVRLEEKLDRRNCYSNTKQKVLVDRAKIHYDKSLKLSPIVRRQNKPKATTCERDIQLRNLFYQTVFYKIKANAS